MTTDIKNMSISELNNQLSKLQVLSGDLMEQIAELNQKVVEITNKMNVISTALNERKEQVKKDFLFKISSAIDAMKDVLACGIDPASLLNELAGTKGVEFENVLTSVTNDDMIPEENIIAEEQVDKKASELVPEKEAQREDIHVMETSGPDKQPATDQALENMEGKEYSKDTCEKGSEGKSTRKYRPRLLSPYYELWDKLVPAKKKKPSRKPPVTSKKSSHKRGVGALLEPYYNLYTCKPIKKILKLGNKKSKPDYPDPEEGRIMSADGIMNTLTRCHSDFFIYIPPRPDKKIEMASVAA